VLHTIAIQHVAIAGDPPRAEFRLLVDGQPRSEFRSDLYSDAWEQARRVTDELEEPAQVSCLGHFGDGRVLLPSRTSKFPWCDTCHQPAAWTVTFGFLHFKDGPVYPNQDQSGHEVTAREWNARYGLKG